MLLNKHALHKYQLRANNEASGDFWPKIYYKTLETRLEYISHFGQSALSHP